MPKNVDISGIEKKAYMSYYQDGILDLFVGAFILSFGVGMIFDIGILPAIFAAIGLPLWFALKKSITYPRLGLVKFSHERREKEKKEKNIFMVFFTFTMLFGVVVFMAFSMPGEVALLIKNNAILIFGGVIAGGIALGAFVLGVRRMYGYAVLTFSVFFLGDLLGVYLAYYFFVAGGAILLCGTFVLMRFLHKYQLTDREM